MVFGEAEEEAGGYGDETIGMGMLGKAGSKIRLASDNKSKRAFSYILLILLPKLDVLTLSRNNCFPPNSQGQQGQPTPNPAARSVVHVGRRSLWNINLAVVHPRSGA